MISAYSLSSIFISVCYYNHFYILVFLDSYSTMCLASLSFSLYCLLTFKVTYCFQLVQNWERNISKLYIVTLFI